MFSLPAALATVRHSGSFSMPQAFCHLISRQLRRCCSLFVLCGLAVGLSGCGDGERRAQDGQVAARVNKGEITVHQIQQVLQRQPGLAARPEAAARRALDSLIEQELAAQAARADGMENDPAVVQAMQVARREVLARAYQDRLAAKASGLSSDEIDNYYDSQPALFARRRIYTLQECLVEVPEAEQPRLQQLVNAAANPEALEEGLRGGKWRFQKRQFAQAAEDVPLALLQSLSQLDVGRSFAVPQGGAVRVFSILHAQSAPIERRVASPAIAAFLSAERRRDAVGRGMKGLRDSAKVEYVGTFADAASAAKN